MIMIAEKLNRKNDHFVSNFQFLAIRHGCLQNAQHTYETVLKHVGLESAVGVFE